MPIDYTSGRVDLSLSRPMSVNRTFNGGSEKIMNSDMAV